MDSVAGGKKWGWSNFKFEGQDSRPSTPVAKKAKKILNMVNKPLNLGIEPIDGDDKDIYSNKKAVNLFSVIGPKTKYQK
jgi:hypothetical protein